MVQEALFKDIFFLADGTDATSIQMLLRGGATKIDSLDHIADDQTVHLITNDYNSPLSLAVRASRSQSRCTVCTPVWIKTSFVKGRLQDPKRYSPDPRQFFTGVCVTCSELPDGDKEAIYGGVLALGGQYSDILVKGTTHIVALTLNSSKTQEALKRPREGIEIVLPHWFDDCLKLRRRIPSDPYRFPHPKILQTNQSGLPPAPTSQSADYQYLCDASFHLRETPDTSEDVFTGKRIVLGTDLNLGDRLLKTITTVLANAGAVLVNTISEADVYVGQFRDGLEYVEAAKANKIVGNYTWILYCVARGKYSSPRDHLLHYPVPRRGLLDFQNDIITVSNYTGEARSYLERLITALGAKFTRNMKPENTHLITAVESGEKYNTAKLWNINCVNHLWLEESYAKWDKQAVTTSHYVTFPRETNLMDVIAQTPIALEGIESFYTESDTEDEEEVARMLTKDVDMPTLEPMIAVAEELEQDAAPPDMTENRETSPSLLRRAKSLVARSSAVQAPHSATIPIDSSTRAAIPRSESKKRSDISASVLEPQTPSREPANPSTPRGSTARKASQAAASKLRDNMEDANNFDKQRRNKHKLPPLPSEIQPALKKAKNHSETPPSTRASVRVCMTGCPELTENLHRQCEALGVEMIDDPSSATHLIAPRVARTKKFVVAIPQCPHFVNWQWLLDTVKKREIQAEAKYLPASAPAAPWSKDLDFVEVLERARSLQDEGGLLSGIVILVSDAVTKLGGFETYRDIVHANGGTCGLIGRRGTDTTSGRVIMVADGKDDPAVAKYVKANSRPGKKGKENSGLKENCEVYDREWLMICAIRQELKFEKQYKLN